MRTKNKTDLYKIIVNEPFKNPVHTTELGLGIIVLLLINKQTKTIDRIALSKTDLAAGAIKMSELPFNAIRIPIDHKQNAIVRAINTKKQTGVSDWQYLFIPALDPQAARLNQAGAGVEYSVVSPFYGRRSGALIFSYFLPRQKITNKQRKFMQTYTELVSELI